MTHRRVLRTGIIVEDLQSRFLIELFKETELSDITEVALIDLITIRQSIVWRVTFRFLRTGLGVSDETSQKRTDCLAIVLLSRVKRLNRVCALDNQLNLLVSVAESFRDTAMKVYAIQMGTNPKYFQSEGKVTGRLVPITLVSWGLDARDNYSRDGLVPTEVLVTGSLKRAVARRRAVNTQEKKWELCLVSQFRPAPTNRSDVSVSAWHESQSMPRLVQLLKPIIVRNRLRTVVALKAGRLMYSSSLEALEIEYFRSSLGDVAEVIESDDPYASYDLAESSRLTIGRNSGLLTEMLDSNSRVLFVNPTDFERFNAPIGMPYRLNNPTERQLEIQILDLLAMSQDVYLETSKLSAEYYCASRENGISILATSLSNRSS